jgi:hypothetical protein
MIRLVDRFTIELEIPTPPVSTDARILVAVIRVLSQLSNTGLSSRAASFSLLRCGDSLSYSYLAGSWRRSLRNGSWGRLSICERGLFRCTLWLAKTRGKISNGRLMVQILRIALKLLDTVRSRIAKAGRTRAMMMSEAYAKPGGVFSWAPRMREWLYDPRYIWYLGVMEVNA